MFAPGDELHGFRIIDVTDLPEFRTTGILAEHIQSGARVFHTQNDDPENLFAFIFRTAPDSSNGVSHILEHTVLCGSERFPVKDPFVSMLKGSMQIFLNAFTYPDKTVYPASSTVPKDLFNLMDVYGDAVFFPLLREEHFRQEGHRLEVDESGKLIRTGIVYNEMKGNYSTHDSVASDWTSRSLFPDTPYKWDSGGDPAAIPELTYEAFRNFHANNYHPSNCLVYLYGTISTADYLEFLDRQFFSKFEKIAQVADIPLQDRWTEPRVHQVSYPAGQEDEEGRRASVTLSWLLFPVEDRVKLLSMELLTDILMGSPASPLQKLAAETDLGEELSPTSGLETELRQTFLSVGLQGSDPEQAAEIEKLFLDELASIVREGLNDELVDGTIRRYEFRNREIRGGGPYGLRLLRKLARGWLHGVHPAQTLEFAPVLAEINKLREQNPRYFESLIQSELLDNSHRCTLVVAPDATLLERNAAEERRKLDELTSGLDAKAAGEFVNAVAARQKSLKAFQEETDSPEARAKLPFLSLSDLPREVETIPTETEDPAVVHPSLSADGGNIFTLHKLFTNGITYADLYFSFDDLTPDEELLLPLWTSFVSVAGTKYLGYEDVSRKLGLVSGGFYVDADVAAGFVPSGAGGATGAETSGAGSVVLKTVVARLKALDGDIGQALSLALDILGNADFSDHEHLAEVFYELRNDYRSSLIPSGSSYAQLRTEIALHPSAVVSERLQGITQYLFLQELAAELEKDRKGAQKAGGSRAADGSREVGNTRSGARTAAASSSFLAELEESLRLLTAKIVKTRNFGLNLTGEESGRATALRHVSEWIADLPATAPASSALVGRVRDCVTRAVADAVATPYPAPDAGRAGTELWEYPSMVAFSALSFPASPMDSAESVAEVLLSHNLRTGYLWEEIRMKGGAYGASASADPLSRIFSFSSYRDPNIQKTFDAFASALDFGKKQPPEGSDLVQTKIGVLSREMRPLAPGDKGIVGYKRKLGGITDKLRQQRRDIMMGLSSADLSAAAGRLRENLEAGRSAVIGGKEMLEAYSAGISASPAPVTRSLRR